MPTSQHLEAVAQARQRIAAAAREGVALDAEVAVAAEEIRALERRGAPARDRRAAAAKLRLLRRRRAALAERLAKLEAGAIRARGDLAAGVGPEDLVSQLDGTRPVVLLPVRIETRFFDDGRELRIRVFPDALHVHAHEPELSATEQAFGRDYWHEWWAAGPDEDRRKAAWRSLAGRFNPMRGAWIADRLTPTNLAEASSAAGPEFPSPPTKGAAWSRPPVAAALPERWVAIGIRNGREVFRSWGNPVPDELAFGPSPDPEGDAGGEADPPPELVETDLPPEAGMQWMLDYAEAERLGMAITVKGADLAGGVDRLIVLGVDWSRTPEDSAAMLGELLTAQLHTDGLGLLRQGSPTNNTGGERSGYRSTEQELLDALDPGSQPPDLAATSNARRLAAALGLNGFGVFDRLPNGALREDDNADHMNNALWEATLGYFLDHMMNGVLTSAQTAQLRTHVRKYVRGRGPLPTLRIGDQPYGVLPIVASNRWRPSDTAALDSRIMGLIDDVRGLWTAAAHRSPHMGRTGDVGRDLLDVLQHTPTASSVRFRTVFGPLYVANTAGLGRLSSLQELTSQWTMTMVGAESVRSRLTASVLNPQVRRLTIPFVQRGEPSETAGLEPDYVSTIARRLSRSGGFVAIRKTEPESLLHALLAHGAQLEMGKAAARLVADFEFPPGSRPPKLVTGPDPEMVSIESTKVAADTLVRIAERKVGAISGNKTLANHIASISAPSRVPATRSLAGFRTSLGHLSRLSTAELERLLTESLDCASHRIDAWLTSFATKRLSEIRSEEPAGVYVGGFGWVEDLRPDTAGDSLGFVHTPSMAHAATAAILRSGHLNHADDEASPLAVDLSSSRVREALHLIDGVRRGQPVGALVGFRVERALREHRPRLARYILPFRRLAPLATSEDAVNPIGPVEAIAARDVVDGVTLLAKWKADESKLFADAGVAATDAASVRSVLERADDRLDAVADLMVSESVYQSVIGNRERAGAAAAALDRQTVPPEPDIVRTPRTGRDFVYRVAVMVHGDGLPASWANAPIDARAAAEPRMNAWVGAMLGDPRRVRFAAEVLDGDGTVIEVLEARLSDLALSPLSVVETAAAGSSGRATEFEERLASHFSQLVAAPGDAAELVILSDRRPSWPRSAVPLAALLALCAAIRRVLTEGRPLEPADLGLPEEPVPASVDLAELTARADRVEAAARAALEDLRAAIVIDPPDAARLRTALHAASAAGTPGAVPVALGSTPADGEALTEQARQAASALERAIASAADAADDVDSQMQRIRAVFGASFPLAPQFTLSEPEEIAASLADGRALTGGDRLAPANWLQRMALVRPGAQCLAGALRYAEMLGAPTDATDLAVAQLPHRPGDRWLATAEETAGSVPFGRISILALTDGRIDPTLPLAGMVVDEWGEMVPNRIETTGVAFHFDAPGARAPQAVLLAVPPDPEEETWSFGALADTVIEALDLARMRAVDPQQLWMAGRFLPALYIAHNVARDTASIDFFALQDRVDRITEGES